MIRTEINKHGIRIDIKIDRVKDKGAQEGVSKLGVTTDRMTSK